jgi:hypothetical protein
MAACQKAGLILEYAANGKQYLEILDFGQQLRSASKCPDPRAIDSNCYQMPANEHLDVSVSVSVSDTGAPPDGDDLFAGVSPQIVKDFKAIRRLKKAAITKTAVDGIKREAGKAGLTLEAALEMCCERGWSGFKAEWVTGDRSGQPAPRQRKQL